MKALIVSVALAIKRTHTTGPLMIPVGLFYVGFPGAYVSIPNQYIWGESALGWEGRVAGRLGPPYTNNINQTLIYLNILFFYYIQIIQRLYTVNNNIIINIQYSLTDSYCIDCIVCIVCIDYIVTV